MESKIIIINLNTRNETKRFILKNEINEPIDKIFKRWAYSNLDFNKYYAIHKSLEFENLELIPCFNIFEHMKYIYSEDKA